MTDEVILDRYRIERQLGRGGHGEVFLAEDTIVGRTVAVKKIDMSSKSSSRALNEARAAGQLNHPNVVTVYDFESDQKNYYLIMEFIDGVTLAEALSAKSPLSIEEALDIGIQVTEALEAAHTMDIVHRDIKPDNIMLTKDGDVKVTDFGIARLAASTMTAEGDILGTFAYMSPEQAKSGRVDARSDIFSLGVVLYQMLTGVSPFASATPAGIVFKITNLDPQPLAELNDRITPDMESLILRMLEKDRKKRVEDITVVRHYLEGMREAKLPSRKIVRPLYRLAKSGGTPSESEETPWRFAEPVSNAKEAAAAFILRHRSVSERFFNAAVMTTFIGYLLVGTRFFDPTINMIALIVYFAAAVLFPRVGLGVGFATLILPVADYSLIVAVLLAIVVFLWVLSFWLVRPIKTVFAFLAPLANLGGVGLSYPLVTGLLWNPIESLILGFLGGLFVMYIDLFAAKSLSFITAPNAYNLTATLAGSLNPFTASADFVRPLIATPLILIVPFLWSGVAALVSVLARRNSLKNDFYALAAGAGVLLVGHLTLMTTFHWSGSYVDSLLKTFVCSLIIPLGLLTLLPRQALVSVDEDDADEDEDED